jgi:hypothetical protein
MIFYIFNSSWLRHYATSRKVVDSSSDDIFDFLPICPILPTLLGPETDSASNRNQYQKKRKKEKKKKRRSFWGVERRQRVILTNLPPSVSQLFGQCGILNVSKPYRPPRPGTGIVLLLLLRK